MDDTSDCDAVCAGANEVTVRMSLADIATVEADNASNVTVRSCPGADAVCDGISEEDDGLSVPAVVYSSVRARPGGPVLPRAEGDDTMMDPGGVD